MIYLAAFVVVALTSARTVWLRVTADLAARRYAAAMAALARTTQRGRP